MAARSLVRQIQALSLSALVSFVAYSLVISRIPTTPAVRRLRAILLDNFVDEVDRTANINRRARIGSKCTIGPHAGVGDDCVLSGEVHLGPHVTMGPQCYFITGDHPLPADFKPFRSMKAVHRPIFVEEDVFMGARVTVVPGVTIGSGALVAAGAVVTKDVPPGAVVGGNPARVIKERLV